MSRKLELMALLNKMNLRRYFVNRMGPVRYYPPVETNDGYAVTLWCNISGYGSRQRVIYFDKNLNLVTGEQR